MPQALELNREEVRTVAVQIGVREAARQFGLNEDTVKSWSKREGWLKDAEQEADKIEAMRANIRERQGLPPVAPTACEILRLSGQNTRLKLASVVGKQADQLDLTDAQELLLMAPTVKTVIDGAAKLHGWSEPAQVTVNLDLLTGSSFQDIPDMPVIDSGNGL